MCAAPPPPDFPVPPGTVIVVINDTPTVSLEAGGTTASIFIEFTLSNLAASATCEIFGQTPVDCELYIHVHDHR